MHQNNYLSRPKLTKHNAQYQTLLSAGGRFFADGNYAAAADILQQVLADHAANNAEIWSNLGYTQYLLGRLHDSEQSCRKAIKLQPDLVVAYSNLSLPLMAMNKFEETLKILKLGLAIDSQVSDLWVNLGLVYLKTVRITDAIDAFDKSIALEPQSVVAHTNRALSWQEIGQAEKAYELYQTALSCDPNYLPALSNWLMCAQYHSSLSSLQLLANAKSAANTLIKLNQACLPNANKPNLPSSKQRFRLGFCSADFRAHPVGWFLRDVFSHLANEFDCYCYVNQTELFDDVTAEFKSAAQGWLNSQGMNPKQLLQQFDDDGIDLLIDLAGHTSGNQLNLFASSIHLKKISWLGYPATTGLSTLDGVLLSEDLICTATSSFFSEAIVPVSGPQFVYRPPDYMPSVGPAPFIKNNHITFGCFNNLSKLNDSVLSCWAQLMLAMPTSRLLLKWKTLGDLGVRNRVLKRLHTLGIDASRVELRAASEHVEMLQQYNDIDIALDPFPFSGALTTFEAIWMGVPVITLYGVRPISRQSFSINKALGLSHLSVQTPAEYVQAALNLAGDADALAMLKTSLRANIAASSLSDTKTMSKRISAVINALLIDA